MGEGSYASYGDSASRPRVSKGSVGGENSLGRQEPRDIDRYSKDRPMGGGPYASHNDASRPRVSKGSVRGENSLGRQDPRDIDRYSEDRPMGSAKANLLDHAIQVLTDNDALPLERDSAWRREIPTDEWPEDLLAISADRLLMSSNTVSDLPRLTESFAKEYYELEIFCIWDCLGGGKYGAGTEYTRLAHHLEGIKVDIARLLLEKRGSSGYRRGMKEPMDSMSFDRRESRAGGRGHQDTHGYRDSDHPKPRTNRASTTMDGRPPGGPGNGGRRELTEADIASTTRGFSSLGVKPYTDGEPMHQLRGSRRGSHPPPAGHGHSSIRDPVSGMGPPLHGHDLENYNVKDYTVREHTVKEIHYQPRGSYRAGPPPPAVHGGSARGNPSPRTAPSSLRHDLEPHTVKQPEDRPRDHSGPAPSAGHNRRPSRNHSHRTVLPSRVDERKDERGSRHSGPPASVGHGRPSRNPSHRTEPLSRRYNLEPHTIKEHDDQPLGSYPSNPPPSAGHGRHPGRNPGHHSGR